MRCACGALACVGWALFVLYGLRPSDWTRLLVVSFYGAILGAIALSIAGAVTGVRDRTLPGLWRAVAIAVGIMIPLSIVGFAAIIMRSMSVYGY